LLGELTQLTPTSRVTPGLPTGFTAAGKAQGEAGERVTDCGVEEDEDDAQAPDSAESRGETPRKQAENDQPKGDAAFGGELQPVVMRPTGDGTEVKG
jgi:hypothetical protein